MNCPYCGYHDSKVIDSREVNEGIRRRRQCLKCAARFTTYEHPQPAGLFVIKKDGRREEFRREKLLAGILKACEKRPLPSGTVNKLVDDIEARLYEIGKAEIPSRVIGDLVMEGLRNLDQIAYIRFASVYREFADITELKEVVDNLASSKPLTVTPASQLPLIPDDTVSDTLRKRRRSSKKIIGNRISRN